MILKFTPHLKNGIISYYFQGFENVTPKWELPCEYLSGLHFTSWDGVLLYSDGSFIKILSSGSMISESDYQELMKIVELGKKRLREIQSKRGI
ncbi:hypothetical protein EO98_10735 [Methanosarcina sp. 2.H.T.1A.6]|nr:hypothetical protein EO97_10735 [Methanosarcina sp. 2.H.T.1A.15]KKG16509.1 hypothetical protein EO94_10500 [Methanosarcina sp. 2.H.T.1A.3]KKG23248.1 hypothetical protein EO98_10735 [Methanosarcina sp. 2.H.T.1A.6]KKG25025.1 hypothetical protein EO96_11650 [Methanosarcina sp. 2.H.T.1A.8]